jgi:hypothetical protein
MGGGSVSRVAILLNQSNREVRLSRVPHVRPLLANVG